MGLFSLIFWLAMGALFYSMPAPMKKGLIQGAILFGTASYQSLKDKIETKLLGKKKQKKKEWYEDVFDNYKGKIFGKD